MIYESERVGLGDTEILTCQGAYCPAARINRFELPTSINLAEMRGCRLIGSEILKSR